MDIEIKRIDAAAVTTLSAVATKAYHEHYAATWKDGGVWYQQTFLSVARLKEEMQDENAWFFLVYHKKEAVGFLKLNVDKPLPGTSTNALELERVYLLKAVSGKGIGTYLMHFVFDIARKENKAAIWLKVMDTNPAAVRFYEKMGFVTCGTHEVPFVQKKEGMRGMYLMQKRL